MRARAFVLLALCAVFAVGAVAQARSHRHHRRAHHHRVHHRAHRRPPAHKTVKPPAPKPAPKPVVVLPAPVPLPAPTPAPTVLNHLQVPEREFSLSLSHPVLTPGRAVIEAVDFGEDPHDLRIQRVGSTAAPVAFAILTPGGRTSKTVELQAGTYRLYCSLGDHDALGMHATLTVR
jgi:hypothetical protein